MRWDDNAVEYQGGETAGFNLFAGYDRANKLAIVVWASLTLNIDDASASGNHLTLEVLDQIYRVSPHALKQSSSAT